ncbi:MAG: hypothetical protein AVDCRST_MAG38-2668, partial [uncultured Solirubrobacteraceae bacterium]
AGLRCGPATHDPAAQRRVRRRATRLGHLRAPAGPRLPSRVASGSELPHRRPLRARARRARLHARSGHRLAGRAPGAAAVGVARARRGGPLVDRPLAGQRHGDRRSDRLAPSRRTALDPRGLHAHRPRVAQWLRGQRDAGPGRAPAPRRRADPRPDTGAPRPADL